MKKYSPQIPGPIPGSEDPTLFSTQLAAALGKQHHKKKGGKKAKKKLKKLEKQLQFLAQEYQRLKGLERKLQKSKKGKKRLKKQLRALELQRQQRQPWWQDAMTVSVPKLLDLMIASKSGQPLKPQHPRALRSQSPLALPPHLD